jgi:RNA polymerase sigma-70 factor (ECF subfamily)
MPADPEQFLPLFLAAQPDLRAFIGSMIPEPAAREDVFQEVAVVLWKSFDRYDPDRSFGAWARGVAVRKIWEDRRHRARLPESLSLEQIEQLSGAFEPGPTSANWRAREQALACCLQELPAHSSRLLRMRYEENLRMEEIARAYQSGADALYQTLSRLRRRLRECVTRRLREFI